MASNIIRTHLSKDSILASVIERIGDLPKRHTTDDVYFYLIRTIIFQQLSGKAASTIFQRFLALFEQGYPYPNAILELTIIEMRAVGLSNSKAKYIQNIAEFAIREKWTGKDWKTYSDEELIAYFTQIKGVGKWTVQMILMFALQRPDVFAINDLVVRNTLVQLYKLEGTRKEIDTQLLSLSEDWRPYRSYVCQYMWQWKDTKV